MRPQRRFLPLLVAADSIGVVVLAGLLVFVVGALGARAHDIEGLVCAAHRDKLQRISNTRIYLRTPIGQQRSGSTGGLNEYIAKISLPQLEDEAAKERAHLPVSCRDE